jgi:hypothetical protein
MVWLRQIVLAAMVNFRRWRREPKVWLAFGLGFVICFLLSNKVVLFAQSHARNLQMMEPFIWTFGDAKSILIISLCLLLLFSEVPNLSNEVPFFLIRMNRLTWLLGQVLYVVCATIIFVAFIFLSTLILAGQNTYPANLWSDTAAILGYSSIGEQIAIPAFVKVLELSYPYAVTLHIFGLMTGYSLVLSGLILTLNLWRGNLGMLGGIVLSGFGFLMNPEVISKLLHLSQGRERIANIIFGWISPLNHATYYMHNFGYDMLPRLWMSYLFFCVAALGLFGISLLQIRNYAFHFTGTEQE